MSVETVPEGCEDIYICKKDVYYLCKANHNTTQKRDKSSTLDYFIALPL